MESHRQDLRKVIGAVYPRVRGASPEVLASELGQSEMANGLHFSVYVVRWPVFHPPDVGLSGLHAEV